MESHLSSMSLISPVANFTYPIHICVTWSANNHIYHSSSNNPNNLPLLVTTYIRYLNNILNFLIPVGIYVISYLPPVPVPHTNYITCCHLELLNSFCPSCTALVLTSDNNCLYLFRPSPPLLPSSCSFPW